MKTTSRAIALALSAVACSTSGNGTVVVSDPTADLSSVSADQKFISYYVNEAPSNGTNTGDLMVQPLPSGTATKVGSLVYSSVFGAKGGEALYFLSGPTASAATGSTDTFGNLYLWAPTLTSAVKLTTGYATSLLAALDNSTLIYVESPTPSRVAGTMTLWLLRTSTCTGAGCAPVQLAANATVGNVAVAIDGSYAAYVLRTGTSPNFVFTSYVISASATAPSNAKQLATSALAPPVAFSPDGTLCAAGAGTGATMQPQVFTNATGAQSAWSSPAGVLASLAFADSQTLIVRSKNASGVGTIYKTTPTASTTLISPALAFAWLRNAPHFIEVQTTATTTNDLKLIDVTAATPTPIALANATSGYANAAEDGTAVRFLENYSPDQQNGALTVAALPSGTLSTVAQNIGATAYAFASVGSKLLYLDASTSPNVFYEWSVGAAKPTQIDTGVTRFVSRGATTSTLYVVKVGGIFSEPLP